MSISRLYCILDLGYVQQADAQHVAAALLAGGADLLQLRAKGHSLALIEDVARRVLPLCQAAGVPFILNDHPALAAALGADGVHLGQDDGSLAAARELTGEKILVGKGRTAGHRVKRHCGDGARHRRVYPGVLHRRHSSRQSRASKGRRSPPNCDGFRVVASLRHPVGNPGRGRQAQLSVTAGTAIRSIRQRGSQAGKGGPACWRVSPSQREWASCPHLPIR